jgi:hypothetical protein
LTLAYDGCRMNGLAVGSRVEEGTNMAARLAPIVVAWLLQAPISGTVVDEKERPVPGVEIVLTAGHDRHGRVPIVGRARSDDAGRFALDGSARTRLLPTRENAALWGYKPGHGLGIVDLYRAGGIDRPQRMVLSAPSARRMTVLDEAGKPVAGASVSPCRVTTGQTSYFGVLMPDDWHARPGALTDAKGVASLPALGRLHDVILVRLSVPGRGTHVVSLPYETMKEDQTLRLGAPGRLLAKLVDGSGGPVAGAEAELWVRSVQPISGGRSLFYEPERIELEKASLRSGPEGTIQTPPLLHQGATYRLAVRAEGFAPKVTDWITLVGDSAELPAIAMGRLRSLEGRVLDCRGNAIAGVVVAQAGGGPSATTDDAGRFRLDGALPGRTFLTARKTGFRFTGRRIEAEEPGPIVLRLSTRAEPPDRTLKTLPGPQSLEADRALARRLIDPILREADAKGDDGTKVRFLDLLRWLDPPGLLERAEKTRFTQNPRLDDYLRSRAALAIAPADLDEAASIAEMMSKPADRADLLVDLEKQRTDLDRARKLALLDRAAAQVRSENQVGSSKLYVMGQIAERWLDLGEKDRAMALFQEGLKLVEALPAAKRTDAGNFIVRMARVEPDLPEKLLKGVGPESWRQRMFGNAAIRLAYEHPAEAERLHERIHEPIFRNIAGLRLCRRLARSDPERARRIASRMTTAAERAYARIFLADGLPEGKTGEVGALLDRALEEMDALIGSEFNAGQEANPAASVLPLIERMAPDRLAEVFWRAVALRAPVDDPRRELGFYDPHSVETVLLSRYDRETAAVFFEPVAAFLRGRALRRDRELQDVAIEAQSALDPGAAVSLVESLPLPAKLNANDPAVWVRYTLADRLAMPPDRRWMRVWRFHAGCGIAMYEEVYPDI